MAKWLTLEDVARITGLDDREVDLAVAHNKIGGFSYELGDGRRAFRTTRDDVEKFMKSAAVGRGRRRQTSTGKKRASRQQVRGLREGMARLRLSRPKWDTGLALLEELASQIQERVGLEPVSAGDYVRFTKGRTSLYAALRQFEVVVGWTDDSGPIRMHVNSERDFPAALSRAEQVLGPADHSSETEGGAIETPMA